MNDKLITKAQLIIRAAAESNIRKREVIEEAIGYVLAFEEELPSSPLRMAAMENTLLESQQIASYIGEGTMYLPKEIFGHAIRFYELRHAAAFNSLKLLSALRTDDFEFKCGTEAGSLVITLVTRLSGAEVEEVATARPSVSTY